MTEYLTILRVHNKVPLSTFVNGVDQNQGTTVFLRHNHDIIFFREERYHISFFPWTRVVKLSKEMTRCKRVCNHGLLSNICNLWVLCVVKYICCVCIARKTATYKWQTKKTIGKAKVKKNANPRKAKKKERPTTRQKNPKRWKILVAFGVDPFCCWNVYYRCKQYSIHNTIVRLLSTMAITPGLRVVLGSVSIPSNKHGSGAASGCWLQFS